MHKFVILLSFVPALALASSPRFEMTSIDRHVIELDYVIDYRVAGVRLLKLAHVEVKLSEGQFVEVASDGLPTGTAVPALIVEIRASPSRQRHQDPDSGSRIFFRISLKTVFHAETFQPLFYRKRVEERMRLPTLRFHKDYLDEVFYHPKSAFSYREDYLTGQKEEGEIDLSVWRESAQDDLGFLDLPTLIGRAFFQPRFFDELREDPGPIKAQLITKSRMYHFFLTNSQDTIKTPLTGRIDTTRSEASVEFRSLDDEVVPFAVWLTAPEDLPAPLGTALASHRIYSLPAAIRYKFRVGALRILAGSVTIGDLRLPTIVPDDR